MLSRLTLKGDFSVCCCGSSIFVTVLMLYYIFFGIPLTTTFNEKLSVVVAVDIGINKVKVIFLMFCL